LVLDSKAIVQQAVFKFFGVTVLVPSAPSRIRIRKRIEHEDYPIPVSARTNGIKLVNSLLFGINEDELWVKSINKASGY
jgi:hypothetical protein